MSARLRARIAVTHAAVSVAVATAVSLSLYEASAWYLTDQRETGAITRAVLDARAADLALRSATPPLTALADIPAAGRSLPMLKQEGRWYAASVTVPPERLPASLLAHASPDGALQRFDYGGDVFLAIAIPLDAALYVEVFPLEDLDRMLRAGAWILFGLTLLLGLIAAAFGSRLAARVVQPLTSLAVTARRIAAGDFSARMRLAGDPDLDPIASAFNDMAEAVQARVARERRFVANVSHELRSPVTAALGSAEILAMNRMNFDERTRGVVDVLVGQVRRMAGTLVDLLEISSAGQGDALSLEAVDVAALCRQLLAAKGQPTELVQGGQAWALTDPKRLERILTNLIDNAMLHAGGVTSIVVEQAAAVVRVHVLDVGPGIAEESLKSMFEPFTRGPQSGATPGAGLGLAIALESAQALGCPLEASNRDGDGCRFTLTMPLATRESEDAN